MSNRKSIARRRPLIVYRVEQDADDAHVIHARAWFADEFTGRMDRERFIGRGSMDEHDGAPLRGQWLDNRDTDALHALPEAVREFVWDFDDRIREALKG